MEFIYPAGAHDWKIKITPRWKSLSDVPCDMKIIDTFDMKVIFHCNYQSKETCLKVWEHLKKAWENNECYWDEQLNRLVWKSKIQRIM